MRGNDSLKTASAVGVLATVYQDSRKFAEAEPLMRQSVAGMEKWLGEKSFEALRYRIEVARICLETGRLDEAESICSHCVNLLEEGCGIQRYFPGVESSLPLMAEIAGRTGHQAQAEARLKRVLATVEGRLGGTHPLLADSWPTPAGRLLYWRPKPRRRSVSNGVWRFSAPASAPTIPMWPTRCNGLG